MGLVGAGLGEAFLLVCRQAVVDFRYVGFNCGGIRHELRLFLGFLFNRKRYIERKREVKGRIFTLTTLTLPPPVTDKNITKPKGAVGGA